jgi:hypothetical protein
MLAAGLWLMRISKAALSWLQAAWAAEQLLHSGAQVGIPELKARGAGPRGHHPLSVDQQLRHFAQRDAQQRPRDP